MTDTDTKKRMDDDRKKLEQQNEQRAKQAEERAKTRGRPTPTQMENDLVKLGHHPELEPDGSQPDPHNTGFTMRQIEGEHGQAGYSTRQVSAQPNPASTSAEHTAHRAGRATPENK